MEDNHFAGLKSLIDDEQMGTPVGVLTLEYSKDKNYKEKIMINFIEYMQIRMANEGLWLNDMLAVPGMSKLMPPTPPMQRKWPKPPKLKPVPKTCRESKSLSQLDRTVDTLAKVGVGLFPPRREDLKRLLDRYKNQVTIRQRHHVFSKAAGMSLERSMTTESR